MTEVDSTTCKKCAKCKSVKLRAEFNRNKSKPDGLGSECRACANAHSKKYHSENAQARIESMRARYRANPEEYKDRARKWEKENSQKRAEVKAAYREKYREKIKEFSRIDWAKHGDKRRANKKEYRANNPGIGAEHVRARQTRKVQAMPTWADREAIKALYRQSAFATRITGIEYHVDHYFPLKSDVVCGLHNEFNLRVVPATVNLSKANKMPTENL